LGIQKLRLWVDSDSSSEFDLDLANICVSQNCRWCDSQMNSEDGIVEHVLANHHESCFERLDLREEDVIGNKLPNAVYVCMECGLFYPTDYLFS